MIRAFLYWRWWHRRLNVRGGPLAAFAFALNRVMQRGAGSRGY